MKKSILIVIFLSFIQFSIENSLAGVSSEANLSHLKNTTQNEKSVLLVNGFILAHEITSANHYLDNLENYYQKKGYVVFRHEIVKDGSLENFNQNVDKVIWSSHAAKDGPTDFNYGNGYQLSFLEYGFLTSIQSQPLALTGMLSCVEEMPEWFIQFLNEIIANKKYLKRQEYLSADEEASINNTENIFTLLHTYLLKQYGEKYITELFPEIENKACSIDSDYIHYCDCENDCILEADNSSYKSPETCAIECAMKTELGYSEYFLGIEYKENVNARVHYNSWDNLKKNKYIRKEELERNYRQCVESLQPLLIDFQSQLNFGFNQFAESINSILKKDGFIYFNGCSIGDFDFGKELSKKVDKNKKIYLDITSSSMEYVEERVHLIENNQEQKLVHSF